MNLSRFDGPRLVRIDFDQPDRSNVLRGGFDRIDAEMRSCGMSLFAVNANFNGCTSNMIHGRTVFSERKVLNGPDVRTNNDINAV